MILGSKAHIAQLISSVKRTMNGSFTKAHIAQLINLQ